MRKPLIHIYAAVAAALTVTACEQEASGPDAVRDFPAFSATIDGQHSPSRAVDDYWEKGDKIGISGGHVFNICYVNHDGEDLFAVEDPEQQIYFQNSDPVEFVAYYPFQSSLQASSTLAASTADQTVQTSFDFLWAKAEGAKSSPDVTFEFKHKMSKVTFAFHSGKGMNVSDIKRYRLRGFVMDGTFSISEGTCRADESSGEAAVAIDLEHNDILLRDGDTAPSFILFPQLPKSDPKLEIFDADGQYYVCNLAIPGNELEAGNNYTFNITVNKTGLTVSGCSLSDWIELVGKEDASSADE